MARMSCTCVYLPYHNGSCLEAGIVSQVRLFPQPLPYGGCVYKAISKRVELDCIVQIIFVRHSCSFDSMDLKSAFIYIQEDVVSIKNWNKTLL